MSTPRAPRTVTHAVPPQAKAPASRPRPAAPRPKPDYDLSPRLPGSPLALGRDDEARPGVAIGAPDHAAEREADLVAEQVAAFAPAIPRPAPPPPASGGSGQSSTERAVEASPDREMGGRDAAAMRAAAAEAIATREPGAPLSSGLREVLERRLGTGLGHVRVHTGAAAERSASVLGARAFAHGSDIWLGRGESPSDPRLMAHEVAHVVQRHAGVVRRQVAAPPAAPAGGAPPPAFGLAGVRHPAAEGGSATVSAPMADAGAPAQAGPRDAAMPTPVPAAASAAPGGDAAAPPAAGRADAPATAGASTPRAASGAPAPGQQGGPAATGAANAPASPAPHAAEDAGSVAGAALLAEPGVPLARDAAAHIDQIDADAAESAAAVRATAASRRGHVRAYFAEKRQAVTRFFDDRVQVVFAAVDGRRAAATEWLLSRGAAAQAFAAGLYRRAMDAGARVGGAVQRGAATAAAAVVGGVGGIIDRVLSIARAIPIPNIPGLGTVRNLILGAAERVAGAVRRALSVVTNFIQRVVSTVVGAVLSLASRIGRAILGAIDGFVSMASRAVAWISDRLGALTRRIRDVLLATSAGVKSALSWMETRAVGRVDREEAGALADIERNRLHGRGAVHQVLEFCYQSGDFPHVEGAAGPMEIVDNTSSKPEFETAARTAMSVSARHAARSNAEAVAGFARRTSTVVAGVAGAVAAYLGDVWARVRQGFQEFASRVAREIARVVERVASLAASIASALRGLIGRVATAFGDAVRATADVLSAPIRALSSAANSIAGAVGGLFRRLVARAASLFSPVPAQDVASSVTGPLEAFTPARLAAAARMASPPAAVAGFFVAIELLLAEAAAATLASLSVVLMWVAIVLIVILLLVLIFILIKRALSRPRAVPRAPAKPRAPARPRRRPRRPRKPLYWNPSLSYGLVLASGGVPGTLDTRARLPARAPLHAHHVWPKYVGGPVVQPLMSIRDTVHLNVVHPWIHTPLAATALSMGFIIVRNVTNVAFIAHLRRNVRDRTTFAAVMTGAYAGLNSITHPAIPPAAYVTGITYSFPRI